MIQRDGGPPKRHSTPVGVVWVGSPGETRQNLPALGVVETIRRAGTDERAARVAHGCLTCVIKSSPYRSRVVHVSCEMVERSADWQVLAIGLATGSWERAYARRPGSVGRGFYHTSQACATRALSSVAARRIVSNPLSGQVLTSLTRRAHPHHPDRECCAAWAAPRLAESCTTVARRARGCA